jgi:catechol 2,3-dioxygenase-like lactoylglutathione lyase family enzyme
MSDFYDASSISPVPAPGPDAVAPEPFRGIYGMPAFATVPTADLAASTDFWTRGLGFFSLFAIPGRLVHLRRWAFQDVLLVPAAEPAQAVPALTLNFACVLSEADPVAEAARSAGALAVEGPTDTPWNTRDVEIVTPESVRVVFTAGKPLDPAGAEARDLASVGIVAPGQTPAE